MRTLTNCANQFEAQLIVGRLENEGIKAVALHEHTNTLSFLGNSAYALGVRVAVNDEDYHRALTIISVDGVPDDELED